MSKHAKNSHCQHLNTVDKVREKIIASNDTIHEIVHQEINKYGLNADLNHIDTSLVTDFSYLFSTSEFNGDISQWNTSNALNMSYMFYLSYFNGDISKWDVSQVKNMSHMFCCSDFTGDISNWNVSSLICASGMFFDARFNGDISRWDMSHVTDTSDMLSQKVGEIHISFQQDVSGWQLKSLNYSKNMFVINRLFSLSNLLLLKTQKKTSRNLELSFYFDKDFSLKNKDDFFFFKNFIHFMLENKIPFYDEKSHSLFINSPYPFLICNTFNNSRYYSKSFVDNLKELAKNSFYFDSVDITRNLDLLFVLLYHKQQNNYILERLLTGLFSLLSYFEELALISANNNQEKSKENHQLKTNDGNNSKNKTSEINYSQFPLFTSLTQLFFEYEKQLIEEKNEIYFNYLEKDNKMFSDFYPYYNQMQKQTLIALKNEVVHFVFKDVNNDELIV